MATNSQREFELKILMLKKVNHKSSLSFMNLPIVMQDRKTGSDDADGDVGVATKVRVKTKRPSLYRVLLLNDDFTPMEFVVHILKDVFNRSGDDAQQIMMHVHVNGVGECGVYPFEVAETKVMLVMDAAQKDQHPLQCVMEKK